MKKQIQGWSTLLLLTAVCATMKLIGLIDWSWLWVFFPLWGLWVLSVMLTVALILAKLIIVAVKDIRGGRDV